MDIQEKAHAKINLTLDIIGKRSDGYHELRTIYQSLALCDTLTFSASSNGQISLVCNLAGVPLDENNLAYAAAELLRTHYRVKEGVFIEIKKKIPMAAGLAGGSSNAAAALRGLVRFWKLPHEPVVLNQLAARLGSDVPFCLRGGTALGTGRGEKVTPLPACPGFSVVLANPGFAVSTADAYRAYRQEENRIYPDTEGLIDALAVSDKAAIMQRLANVLESATFVLHPAVRELKRRMASAGTALMCGSGPTVFALFTDTQKAKSLYSSLCEEGIAAWLTETNAGIDDGSERHV